MNPSETDQQQVCQPCLTKPPLKVRISFFFDGTLNNMENVRAGTPDKGGSYANDLTNVVRLYDALLAESDSFSHHLTIYTEGVGTISGEDDDLLPDAAFSIGDTGVKEKAKAGWHRALEEMNSEKISKSARLDITIDVFGFSRGAACARYFIHAFLNNQDGFRNTPAAQIGYETIIRCYCKYAGLFDTVASYGWDHDDDTTDLNLDAVRLAESGLHLCAAEEHREKFRLTDTRNSPGICELFLPGVHADIGGGYRDNSNDYGDISEKKKDRTSIVYQARGLAWPWTKSKALKKQKKWLTDRGWYHDDELTSVEVKGLYMLAAKRNGIRNGYTYIPMQIMADHSMTYGNLKYDKDKLKEEAIPPDLKWLKTKLETCLNKGTHYDWMNDTSTEMQKVRHTYFHFSARYNGIGNDPQWSDEGTIDGKRQRTIQAG